ncbi:hypothetical protein SAMN05192544_11561, partial [Paraburkholderia hospita]
ISPAPLTTEGDSLLPAGREGGGWVGAAAGGGLGVFGRVTCQLRRVD